MGTIIIAEDTEIMEAIRYYIEMELNTKLIKYFRSITFLNDEQFMFHYNIRGKKLYTYVANGYANALKIFKLTLKHYKRFHEDNIAAIFLYFDSDVKHIVNRELERLREEFPNFHMDSNKHEYKYEKFKIYVIFLGTDVKLCNKNISNEFESLLLERQRLEIENELCEIIRNKNLTKASLILPLKIILLHKEKPRIQIYLSKCSIDLRDVLRIKEVIDNLT